MAYYSPLRYPGGKGRLSDYMKLIIKKNNINDGIYIEPYAGGAGIALSLLFNEYVSKIVINDLSVPIYSFWYSVLNFNDKLCNRIINTPVTIEEWHKQCEVQERLDQYSIFDIGFSTFYLNRTNRSGILTGGVIGGISQEGKYKIDARFNKEGLIRRIKKIGRYNTRIVLCNMDASDLIYEVLPGYSINNTLVYLDPPYYNKGKHLYENHYKKNDHKELSEIISTIEQKWIVTYDNTPQISELYNMFRQITYSLSYSAAKRYKGSEIMIFSDDVLIPEVENPVKVKIN